MKLHLQRATALASALACTLAAASLMLPLHTSAATTLSAAAEDLGLATAGDMKDFSLSLALVDRAGLERFVASTVDRTSPNYRRFITPAQFAARHGQPDAVVSRVTSFLESRGLTVTHVFGNKLVLSARGTNAQLASVFGVAIHSYLAHDERYEAPTSQPTIPAELRDVVDSVVGLDTRAVYKPHHRSIDAGMATASPQRSGPAGTAPPVAGIPGQYTVADLAKQYDITPLYSKGLSGAGTTIGIMTFAAFNKTDVSTYWAGVGVPSDTSRISVVTVPGGKISTDADGEGETSLDIEQSGGVATGAKIIVYEAPNNGNGALALYTTAVDANKADTLSISWGGAEGANASALAPYDAIFLQAAAQGTPIIASSDDSGAYDYNGQEFPYPYYSLVLSVDFPASSPYVLAAGGTTLPGTYALSLGSVTVPAVRPWAWDYLYDYTVANHGETWYYTKDYPVGGGGGVSVNYPLPTFQQGLAGTMSSVPGQSLFCLATPPKTIGAKSCKPGTDLVDLPPGIAGRNVPDVSLDADPISGYSLFAGGAWTTGYGGTSFVAPQLNGIFSLITQQNGQRVGWLAPQLYAIFKTQGYASGSPFRAVNGGDNEFWTAAAHYNPASGLGQLDVANLAKSLAP